MWLSFILLPAVFGVAQSLPVADENVSDGHIVVVAGSEYRLARDPYDPNLYGVVTLQPPVLLDIPDLPGRQAVVSSGVAQVSVAAGGGPISPGDYITSSNVPGIGMRATQPGFVLGVAQEAWSPQSPEEIGQVEVAISPHYASQILPAAAAPSLAGILSDFFNLSAAGITDRPSTALRYAVATLILGTALVFGLLVFGRVAANGIAAMGRNPLARYAIGFTVVLNLIICVVVIGAGVALAYVVLVI